ncbi:P-loop containing nucleoside triphosphate hydrolase protein [Ceraceosorus guamensis]|uniref:Structural maintenance of chromosomes protein 5 n=1 Tax=Ceraceosorus guamensis TaxID=1522189 RepID=A0A316VWR0_9BASI|nr:P-loop containing nucleoside triphosphate hydrolase protein [Ceraceosorus guamensis]PWN39895.1 P-loop containing nucleoside triphosphate hydrolase protein [Ceraceosorus guamensis]
MEVAGSRRSSRQSKATEKAVSRRLSARPSGENRAKRRIVESADDEDAEEASAAQIASTSNLKREGHGDEQEQTEEDDADDSGYQAADADMSLASQKRQRLEEPIELAEDEDEAETKPAPSSTRNGADLTADAGTLTFGVEQRNSDGYLPGSIVRVKLEHFVTYDAVEFYPGPHLNMIIGPNGTGKSTVVCAIALGLGWKPAVLGRARDVAAYVKQGYENGTIEIELKGRAGGRNLVVRREITKSDNKSEWYLNGSKTTHKEIMERTRQLHIQIENLCSFLPQDKVADFARMQPPELLRETQRAAGEPRLTEWHDELIKLGQADRELKQLIETESKEIENLRERNEVLQRDVRRYEERRAIEKEVELLKIRIPFARYAENKREYDRLKNVRNKRKKQHENLMQDARPVMDALEQLQDQKQKLDLRLKTLHTNLTKDMTVFRRRRQECTDLDNALSNVEEQRDSVKRRVEERQKHVKTLQTQIAALEQETAEEPDVQDTSSLDRELREIKEKIRSFRRDRAEISQALDEIANDSKTLHAQKTDSVRKLAEVDNVKEVRLAVLAKADSGTAKGVKWIRENPGAFQEKVYEPIMLELSVRDPESHADAVESCVNWQIQRTFVCQTRADYDFFTRELIDKQKLRLNVVELEGQKQMEEYQRPCSQQQLEQLGFHSFLVDLVDGPAPILAYLCKESQLHTIPVADDERRVNAEQIERSGKFKRFIVGNTNHTIQQSNYDKTVAQTLSRGIRAARSFSISANVPERLRLDKLMGDIANKMSKNEAEASKLQKRSSALDKQLEGVEKRKAEVEEARNEIADARYVWERAKVDLETKRKALHTELRRPTAQAELAKLDQEMKRTVQRMLQRSKEVHVGVGIIDIITRLGHTLTLAALPQGLVMAQMRARAGIDVTVLEQLQHGGQIVALENLIAENQRSHREAKRLLDEAGARLEQGKRIAMDSMTYAQRLVDEADAEVIDEVHRLQREDDRSVVDLEDMLANEQAKLDLVTGVNEGVIAAYQARKQQIDQLEKQLSSLNSRKASNDRNLNKILPRYETHLDKLIERINEKFSAAFERINCNGEVKLEREEDYAKWGIVIWVKFRATEKLQPLTGQRQSGGERSLSTILYLMSLTELSRSPFSLVDEINQGMDMRVERMVHDQMVEVTCKDDAGQYFLITPKLLSGLKYHRRMKILVINNGEWLPEKFSFDHYIQRQKKRRLSGNAAARAAA